jgi:hypothetical protein
MPHGMPLVAALLVTAQSMFGSHTPAEGRAQGCRHLWLRERPLTVPFNGVAL